MRRWLHTKCAGITCPAFGRLSESDVVFLCTYCMLISQSNEISKLALSQGRYTYRHDLVGQSLADSFTKIYIDLPYIQVYVTCKPVSHLHLRFHLM